MTEVNTGMKNNSQVKSTRLKALLDRLGMSQAEFARAVEIEETNISTYLSGKKGIGPFNCLLIAGIADTADEKAFWMTAADLSKTRRALIVKACGAQTGKIGSRERIVQQFLEFWETPESDLGSLAGLRQLIKDNIFSESEGGKDI